MFLLDQKDYWFYNTEGQTLDNKEWVEASRWIRWLVDRLITDQERLAKRSARDRERLRPVRFFIRLLEFQARHLKRDLPVSAEDKKHLRYRQYINTCARLAGFDEAQIENSIWTVIMELRRRRKTGRHARETSG